MGWRFQRLGADGKGVETLTFERGREGGEVLSFNENRTPSLPPPPKTVGRRGQPALRRGKAINSPRAPLPALSGKAPSLLLFVPES